MIVVGVDGSPASHLALARERDARLIALGSSGRGAVDELVMGSVSTTYCARHRAQLSSFAYLLAHVPNRGQR